MWVGYGCFVVGNSCDRWEFDSKSYCESCSLDDRCVFQGFCHVDYDSESRFRVSMLFLIDERSFHAALYLYFLRAYFEARYPSRYAKEMYYPPLMASEDVVN